MMLRIINYSDKIIILIVMMIVNMNVAITL